MGAANLSETVTIVNFKITRKHLNYKKRFSFNLFHIESATRMFANKECTSLGSAKQQKSRLSYFHLKSSILKEIKPYCKFRNEKKRMRTSVIIIPDPLFLFGLIFTMGLLSFLLISSKKTLNFLYTVFFISIRRPGGTHGRRKRE